MIFIQIASYRDPELVPTIKNLLETADNPDNLVFGIARQYHSDDGFDDLSLFNNDKRFKILNIPYKESMGVCWARRLIQELYSGEDYTLQIDSHMRFVDKWDSTLIRYIEELKDKNILKPIITTYAPLYDPDNDPNGREKIPWGMKFDKISPQGVALFIPTRISDWKNRDEYSPSKFYSGHFAFTIGQFCLDVPHDPHLYFHGEEASISLRAFTNGYDFFEPNRLICWHEYTRKNRTKHWDDNQEWSKMNRESINRYKKLIIEDLEEYGLGKIRTKEEYENHTQIKL